MTIIFRTYDVSCPFTITEMMNNAFKVETTLTMYDTTYCTFHSGRCCDEDGDTFYSVSIKVDDATLLTDDVLNEFEQIMHNWNDRKWCGGEIIR